MIIKLSSLSAVMLFALIGAVLWMLRRNSVSVVTVPAWALEDVDEEEDMPTWDDLT